MKKISNLFLKCLLFVTLIPALVACDDDLQHEFSRQHAFFRFPMVNTTPELRTALNSPGMFCKITFPPQHYLFSDAQGHSTLVNRSSLDLYGKPIFISGFLVGTPSVPDFSSNFYNVAYDLVCPACSEESFIDRELDFNGVMGTEMKCGRCGRVYDLNNEGIVKNRKEPYKLYRYHMTYSKGQGMLLIQN